MRREMKGEVAKLGDRPTLWDKLERIMLSYLHRPQRKLYFAFLKRLKTKKGE
jgi:hypothetical protein